MAYKSILSSIVLICGLAANTYAQRYMGIATGEYSAINSMYLNPASIAGAHEKVVVNLVSVNIGVDNSLGTFTKVGDIGKANTNAFNLSGNEPFSMLVPVIDLRMPAVMVSLNNKFKHTFALTTRVRAMNQFNHFDPSLYNTITSTDHTANQNYNFTSNNFNWTAHVWSEIGVSYGINAIDKGPHLLKAGVTLRYLGGVNYLSMKGNNLDASYTAGSDSFFATNSDLSFASNAITSDDAVNEGIQASGVTGSLFGAKAGAGFGMDIGVSYTYRIYESDRFGRLDDDDEDTKHKITISAAVTDIGAIKYKKNNFVVNVTGNGYLTGSGLSDHLDDYEEFRSYVVTQGFTADTGSKPTKLYMPTALVSGLDFQAYKGFYLNATVIANLANRQKYGTSYYSQVTFTPRYENKLITVGLPLTYSMLANDVKVGLGFRIAGFFFGSDDMLALFSSNQHGFGFYMGGYVPIFKRKAKNSFK